MGSDTLVISKGTLQKGSLSGNVILVTGAGGGIGYETARSLLWLGARVIIGEINKVSGKKAEAELKKEFGEENVCFIRADIGNVRSVNSLVKKIHRTFGKLDAIINNATIAPMGAVHEVGIGSWDLSYKTNLRGPVLLISSFLPEMLKRNSGVIVLVPSSGAAPFMGAYEVFKTSQVELSNTLAAELEQTGVITYSIGPGIVKTETAKQAIEKIAPLYGKSVDEFYKMSENLLLTAEEAGAGFAASVAIATRYRGLEIGSIQVLKDIGIAVGKHGKDDKILLSDNDIHDILSLFQEICKTFTEQIADWASRPIFQRQWLVRDFKKQMGVAPEYFLESLKEFESSVTNNSVQASDFNNPTDKIYSYYQHQIDLLKGYEKNEDRLNQNLDIMQGWLDAIDKLKAFIREILSRPA